MGSLKTNRVSDIKVGRKGHKCPILGALDLPLIQASSIVYLGSTEHNPTERCNMVQKSELLVMVPPPEHLSERSKAIWVDTQATGRVKSAGRLVALEQALTALDRADQARAIVETQGMIIENTATHALHANPAVKIELESRRQFASIWGLLHLEFDPTLDGRRGMPTEK